MKPIQITICVIALAFLALGGWLWYYNWNIGIMRIPPKTPSNLTAKPLSAIQVKLTWQDNSNNELGFVLYRNGRKLAELERNVNEYVDSKLRPATSYGYEVKAYNHAGESDVVDCSVKTLNPPIVVRIDKIGVHENGEEGELFREYDLLGKPGKGEVKVGIVVTDNITVVQQSFPGNGTYELLRDEVVSVNSPLFETQEVGDRLRIVATAYEADGGFEEQLIYKALGIITGSYLDMPTSILFKLAGVDFAKIYADMFGAENDLLGTYVADWTSSDNWGVANYIDISCKRPNGNIGLRLWFTILCPVYDYASENATTQ